jgi:cell division protein FtsQ
MEIKTNRPQEAQNARIVPPPDKARHPRKKNTQRLGKSPIAGRHFVSTLKTLWKIGVSLLVVASLLSIFVYAYTSDKFNLSNITFHGCKEVKPNRLEKIIRTDFPANILQIDLRALKERLEKETWIQRVEIRRVLPSDIILYIQERTPSVILEMHGELMIADVDGTMLDRYEPRYGKLDMPVFKGILGEDVKNYRLNQRENAARIRQALNMMSEIDSGCPRYMRNISEVDISESKNLKILLVDDTAEIYLGEKDYGKRFCTLMSNLGQYEELKNQYNDIPSVDLRFDGQIVYRLGRADSEYSKKVGN